MRDNDQTYNRYQRQITLKEFGESGQRKLLQSKVLVIGAGGLGSAALQYLVAAGVGCVGIIDFDTVAIHNLHRQVLYSVEDIGLPKAQCAAAVLGRMNPDIIIEAYNEKLTVSNALDLFSRYDIIVDGSDNFSTRYLVNDACVLLQKPLVYGAVSKFEGQVAIFNVKINGVLPVNYRDLFPQPPPAGEIANCAEAGVLGVLPGIIGTLQAGETIKLITGMGTPLVNALLSYNQLNNRVFELQLTAGDQTRSLIPADQAAFALMDYDWLCGVIGDAFEITSQQFDQLREQENVLVVDVREPGEMPPVAEFSHINIPIAKIAESMAPVNMDTIIVFCQTGKRSAQAAGVLARRFGTSKKIFSLAGGIVSWKNTLNLKIV